MQIAGDKNSVIIDFLRPFLMLLVIFNHCTGEVGGGIFDLWLFSNPFGQNNYTFSH